MSGPSSSSLPPSAEPDPPEEPEAKTRQSYRERRQESDALAELARTLVDMTPTQLAEVPLPAEVATEVEICRAFRKGPRIRQLRRISQMLRRLDMTVVGEAAQDAGRRQRRRAQREKIYEHWRERLLIEGDPALAELVDQYPAADRQRLRQLLRQAGRDPEGGKAKHARRGVLRLVREACEAGSGPEPTESTE